MSSDIFLYSFYIFKNASNTYINNSSNIMKMINRDYLKKKPHESLSKKEKGKWNNVIMNNTKIYQKMGSKILFSIGKKNYKISKNALL